MKEILGLIVELQDRRNESMLLLEAAIKNNDYISYIIYGKESSAYQQTINKLKSIMSKLKDLTPDTPLKGLKVKTGTGKVGYIISAFNNGIWLCVNEDGNGSVIPEVVGDKEEVLEWEITDEAINIKI